MSIYDIDVIQFPGDDNWLAISEAIPVATEAASFEALIERVWRLAPGLIARRDGAEPTDCRLRFVLETHQAPHAS